MVAAVYVRDGKAAYRSRWVQTDSMRVEVAQGEAIYSGLVNGGTPGRIPGEAPPAKNVANTNVGIFDDHLIVYYEGGLPHQMHPETLQTHGTYDFHGGIDVVCTAHFKIDPATGDMLFFAATGPVITWYRADAKTSMIIDSHAFEIGVPGPHARLRGQRELRRFLRLTDGLARHFYYLDSTVVVDGPAGLTSPSEPVFVARENWRSEDDGYLLSVWRDPQTQLSEMLVHAAADLRRTPLAWVRLPSRVPFGFHGNWADAAILDKAIAGQPIP
jgi:carotenoid cleavage dioxygenase-like enzyme